MAKRMSMAPRGRRIACGAQVFETVQAFALALLFTLNAAAQAARTSAPARVTEPIDMSRVVRLRGNTHPLARPEYDRGEAPDGLPMDRMLLVLKRGPAQETQLRKLLVEQQVKSSPQYHHWLTPEQFGEQFGVDDADIQTVTDWLTSEGFQVDRVSAGRTMIEFSGTAGLVRQAFDAEIHKYVVNTQAYWANSEDPEIPAALAPVVAGIASLNNFPVKRLSHDLGSFLRSKATGQITPLFTFTTTKGTFHGLGPADLATIYNVQPLWNAGINGSGQTIAIVGQSNINFVDFANFRNLFSLPFLNGVRVITNGPDPGIIPGFETEADLDVEWSGAVAPGANIDLVISESTDDSSGIDLSVLYAVDNNIAPVLSMSFIDCEADLGAAGNAFYNDLWEQAAAEGITVVVGAGDSGSAACDEPGKSGAMKGLAVNGFASTPFDVAVGGTDFDDGNSPTQYWSSSNSSQFQSSALSYIPETTWNDTCAQGGLTGCAANTDENSLSILAGSGGPSTCGVFSGAGASAYCSKGYPKPAWQTGAGVPNDGVRDLPDLSLFAGAGTNGVFYIMCEADAGPDPSAPSCNLQSPYEDFQAAGGTSTSAQVFAGVMALVDQKTGDRQGDANYVLYKLAAQPGASCPSNAAAVANSACVFFDVTAGNNSVVCAANSPNCGPTQPWGGGILMTSGSASEPAWTAGPGYDLATGLGSVNVANLVNKWSSVSFSPTTTELTDISPTTITHGQPVSVTIQVTSQTDTPTGAVSLLGGPGNNALGIADFALSGGIASGTTSLLPGGTYSVTAHYAGDGNFGASSSSPPVQITVNKESSQTHLGMVSFDATTGYIASKNATIFAFGSPYILHVGVTNATGAACVAGNLPVTGCPTGSVNLSDNGTPLDLGAYPLNSVGELEDQPIQLHPGSHQLVAAYGGDSSFDGSTSAPDPVTVTQAATATALTSSATGVQAGGSVTLTAVVTTQSNGQAPTGQVQFSNGSSPINGTVSYLYNAVSSTGFADMKAILSAVLPSTTTITASYSGDPNYIGSVSNPLTINVTPGFTISANPASINIASPGQSGTSSITVTSGGGFTGTIGLSCVASATMTGSACSLSPSSLTNSGAATLTVITTAAQVGAIPFNPSDWFLGGGGAVVVCLVVLSFVDRPRFKWGLTVLVLVLLAAFFVACGGQGGQPGGGIIPSNPGTPTGTYNVTVTAASGSLSHAANVPVTIQ